MRKIISILIILFSIVINAQTAKFVTDIKGGDNITTDENLIFRIYSSDTLYYTTGSHITDIDVAIANDTVTITNISVQWATTYSFKIASVDEANQESGKSNAIQLVVPTQPAAPPTEQLIVLTTISTSSTWSPQEIINSGNTLVWEVTGGVTIAETTIDDPSFDMSGNTGTATVTIKSTSNFIGFTTMQLDGLAITSADINEGADLVKVDFYPSTIGSIDLTTNLDLEYIWLQDCNLSTFDLASNTKAKSIYLDYNNNLNTTTLDKIISDLDANSVSNGVLTILTNPGLPLSQSVYDEYQSLIAKGWTIDVPSPTDPNPPVVDGLSPTLSNFYVDATNTSRVYFDSSEIITASTTIGFEITEKTVSGISINSGATTGHFFTVSSAFDFYSNNTIRYEGGSNMIDAEGNGLQDFTLQFITNNLNEPSALNNRYVTVLGAGSHNGTVGNEWTFVEAGTNAVAGQTVWVEAGNYGNINVTISNSGTLADPIKFIGYKTTIGDSPSLTRVVGLAFDSIEMPLLVGDGTGQGIYAISKSYLIVKNIQIENYEDCIFFRSNSFCKLINVYNKDADTCIQITFSPSNNISIIDSYVADAKSMGIWHYGAYNLIENVWAVSSRVVNMDYHITFNAASTVNGYNIIRNSYTHSYYDDTHGDHAISIKGEPTKLSEYTLVENCTIENSGMGIEFRHENSKRNVARNCYGTRTAAKIGASDTMGSLVTFRDGTTNNLVENCTMEKLSHGIYFNDNAGEEGIQAGGHYNKVINSIFKDNDSDIAINNGIGGTALEPTYNEFINDTFYNSNYLISTGVVAFGSTNKFINAIIESIPSYETSPSFSYSDFYTSFSTPSGTGNISVNPYLNDPANGNFTLTASTPATVYDGGQDNSNLDYDKAGTQRFTTKYSMGAYEKD